MSFPESEYIFTNDIWKYLIELNIKIDKQTIVETLIDDEWLSEEIHFENLQLNNAHIRPICDNIKMNSHWKILKLENNKITDIGAKYLSNALKQNTTLSDLFLDNNYFYNDGAELLADALMCNSTLVHLTLSGNNIGDHGAQRLAAALKVNRTLESLWLEENLIGDDGMMALCTSLTQFNRKLEILWVNGNLISDQSVDSIVLLLSRNYTLIDLNTEKNKFTPQGLEKCQKAFKEQREMIDYIKEINDLKVLVLEMNRLKENTLSQTAIVACNISNVLYSEEELKQYVQQCKNKSIYLILNCTDSNIIHSISKLCLENKVLLYTLNEESKIMVKNSNTFGYEDPLIFRLATDIGMRYRSLANQANSMDDNKKARAYCQRAIDIQQKLVGYLNIRRADIPMRKDDM